MLDVELYKIIDPGHFWCKPYSRNRTQQEQYYTLIGKINDYCSKVYDQSNNQLNQTSSIPAKGKICLVKRTSDRCWYRAKILSVFQTINGPQARVLLVDLGERTLVPGLWVQEIPEEFTSISFQTMECVLSDLKPLTLVTSYFDLTTTKQPGETWDVAASEWFKKQVHDAVIQVDVKHIDEDGIHHVLLFANGPDGMVCVNDELINKDFAVLSNTDARMKRDQDRISSLNKERTQELFLKDHKEYFEQLHSSFTVESDSSDSLKHASFASIGNEERHSVGLKGAKYPPITNGVAGDDASRERKDIELSEPMRRHSGSSRDDEVGRVRFVSARLPSTGSGISPEAKTKQLKPILKTSSGYSSSEEENVSRGVLSGSRWPRVEGQFTGRRSTSAHDQNVRKYVSLTEEIQPVLGSDVQQGVVPQAHKYSGDAFSSNHGASLLSNISQNPDIGSSSMPNSRLPHNSDMMPNIGPSWSSRVPTSYPSESSHVPTSYPSESSRVPTSYPSESSRVPTSYPPEPSFVPTSHPSVSSHVPTSYPSQSQRVTHSPSQSPRVPISYPSESTRIPTSYPSESPSVPTSYPSESPRVPHSPSRVPTPSPSRVPTPSPSRVPTPSPSRSPRVQPNSSLSPRVTLSPSPSQRVPSSPMPSKSLCHISKDIFIHGEGLPRPITQMDANIFPEALLRVLRKINLTSPSSFQSNVWPAILRGRDVCGIGASNYGNPLSYLVPIVTQIAEPGVYSELAMGNGPLGLVLCSGWRRAAFVHNQCYELTKNIRNIRVQVVFGAGAEDEQILHLINGCEMIIATPSCFLRMLKKGYTRLNRLCHLVFDDADVLVEERTECIKELMRDYGGLLTSQPNRQAPRQCVAMANKWTPGVCSLVKAYLGNPLILIANPIEAAMFCKVRQVFKSKSCSQRDSQLIGFLDSLTTTTDHEIIIFTFAAKDAERLSNLLQHSSYSVLLAHEFMRPEQFNEVRRQWNTPHSSESYPVLVMTDSVTDKCSIRNSSCVIHYDFPSSKKSFGKRLFCMAASYPGTQERECLSVIFGTEQPTLQHAQFIKQTVARAGGEISTVLEQITEIAIKAKESNRRNLDLCYVLKVFGVCKNSLTSCKERHTVFPDVDVSELLPRSGIVKVLVLCVLEASRYYVRILEHQTSSTKDDKANCYSGATFLKLALDLNNWYSSSNNRCLCGVVQLRKLCVVENEGSYNRVTISRVIREDPETDRVLEVEVYFVDRGDSKDVSTRYLLEIAPEFVDIPFQAVEAIVCRVKPVDEDDDWTKKSYRFVQQNIEGEELEGKVIMGLRNTIWLDPLVKRTHLKEINVTTNTFNVRMDLLKEGLAVPNPEHVKKLTEHFEKFVTMKELTGQEISERCSNIVPLLETATLPEDDFEYVYVSAVETPALLYVRRGETSNSLDDLLDEISARVERSSCRNNEEELAIGSLCVARFTEDDEWYRAKIFSIRPEGEYYVFYVDYGEREWITRDRIVPAWSDILQLPYQAIECSLVNISPTESEWTEQDKESLWDMTENKLLYAKVKSKSGAMYAGTFRYGIELHDTSSEHNVLINNELVLAGNAQATLECHKTLFPEAFEGINSGEPKEHFEEIPEICLQLYKTQDLQEKLHLAKEIKNIVSENLWEKDAIRESGGVRCICRLLGVSKMEAVQEFLVITLAFLAAQNDQNCDEIRREGGLKALCYLLTKTKSVKVQEHTAWALKNLMTNDRNRDVVREFGGVANLCLLLNTTDNDKVQENICWAIVAMCSDNNKNCDIIRESGGLERLFSLLETTNNDSVLENAMWTISSLAGNVKNKVFIGEKDGIQTICSLVKNNHNDKVFKNAVQTLKTLSSYNDKNREIMCRLGMIDVMRRLTEIPRGLQFDTRRLCLDLTQRLLGRTSDIPLVETSPMASFHEPIMCKPIYVTRKKRKSKKANGTGFQDPDDEDDLPPLEDIAERSTPAVHPTTMWSQTKRFVTLSIKLRGVENKPVTNVSEKTFFFRTTHLGKTYELNFELFSGVLPKESKVNVRGSEVLVNLKKAQPSTWKRFLASPEKLAYLSIDFDRWDTDSSNEDDRPRSRVRGPMTKSSKATKLDYTMPRDEGSESDVVSEEEETRETFFDFS